MFQHSEAWAIRVTLHIAFIAVISVQLFSKFFTLKLLSVFDVFFFLSGTYRSWK